MFTRFSRIGLAAALGAGLLVGTGAAVPAQAKTVVACVKKSNGKVKILTTKKKKKKKCKKGWKKVSWNQTGKTGPTGPVGATGPQGPAQEVKDGTGKTLGKFLGIYPAGLPIVSVLIDGGAYLYYPDGKVLPLGGASPSFKTNTCNGTAYVESTSAQTTAFLVGSVGGPTRVVYRPTSPTLGPTSAWAFTATTENAVNLQTYELNNAGVCTAAGALFTGTLITLQPVTAPPDVPGPLTID
ncbi:MAG: hypothetical protein R2687_04915 [Candidatus Nanopelagicales bacterium]